MAKESSEAARGQGQGVTLSCPCGSPRPAVQAFRTPTRTYWRCPACGLVYLSPRPVTSEVEDYYRQKYDQKYGQAEGSPDRSPVFDSVVEHLSEFRKPPGRLLDIGCGDGELLVRLQAMGWTGAGVELSKEAAKRAAARGLTMLEPGWLEERLGGTTTTPYDVIALINVLETVPDPTGLLTRVHRALAPGGLVIIRVSNGRFHLAVRRPVSWLGLRFQQAFHLFVYTPQALKRLLQLTDFQVLSVRNARLSTAPLTLGDRPVRRGLWYVGGRLVWVATQLAYWITGTRAVWSSSFELVARKNPNAPHTQGS